MKKIVFLMDLPNPVHGMSTVNLAVQKHALQANLTPLVINTVPSFAASLFPTKWWSLLKVFHTLLCFLQLIFISLFNIKSVLYRPINGGGGQFYDILYLLVARLFAHEVYIHHHSFNYLNAKSRLFSVLNVIAGKSAAHIVLGNEMQVRLTALYGIDKKQISVVSNLAYFSPANVGMTSEDEVIKIGHLANLCTEKGADTFLAVCRRLQCLNVDFSAKIAGPFADFMTKDMVLTAVTDIPSLQYIGPLYGVQKHQYYQELDCFIFPSRYKNEAEPLVLFEAANFGCLLMGTQRGCMQDAIDSLQGQTFEEDDLLVNNIVDSIFRAIELNLFSAEKKQERLTALLNEQEIAKVALGTFFEKIRNDELPRSK